MLETPSQFIDQQAAPEAVASEPTLEELNRQRYAGLADRIPAAHRALYEEVAGLLSEPAAAERQAQLEEAVYGFDRRRQGNYRQAVGTIRQTVQEEQARRAGGNQAMEDMSRQTRLKMRYGVFIDNRDNREFYRSAFGDEVADAMTRPRNPSEWAEGEAVIRDNFSSIVDFVRDKERDARQAKAKKLVEAGIHEIDIAAGGSSSVAVEDMDGVINDLSSQRDKAVAEALDKIDWELPKFPERKRLLGKLAAKDLGYDTPGPHTFVMQTNLRQLKEVLKPGGIENHVQDAFKKRGIDDLSSINGTIVNNLVRRLRTGMLQGDMGTDLESEVMKATDEYVRQLIKSSKAQAGSRRQQAGEATRGPTPFDPNVVSTVSGEVAALRRNGDTDKDILKKLMRKYHPDVSGGDTAEYAKFLTSLNLGNK